MIAKKGKGKGKGTGKGTGKAVSLPGTAVLGPTQSATQKQIETFTTAIENIVEMKNVIEKVEVNISNLTSSTSEFTLNFNSKNLQGKINSVNTLFSTLHTKINDVCNENKNCNALFFKALRENSTDAEVELNLPYSIGLFNKIFFNYNTNGQIVPYSAKNDKQSVDQQFYTSAIKTNLFIDEYKSYPNTFDLVSYYIRIIPYAILLECLFKINVKDIPAVTLYPLKLKIFAYILEYRIKLFDFDNINDKTKINFEKYPFLYKNIHEFIFNKERAFIKDILFITIPTINNSSKNFYYITNNRNFHDSFTLYRNIFLIHKKLDGVNKSITDYGISNPGDKDTFYNISKTLSNNWKYYIFVYAYIYYINLVFIYKWFEIFEIYNEHSIEFELYSKIMVIENNTDDTKEDIEVEETAEKKKKS